MSKPKAIIKPWGKSVWKSKHTVSGEIIVQDNFDYWQIESDCEEQLWIINKYLYMKILKSLHHKRHMHWKLPKFLLWTMNNLVSIPQLVILLTNSSYNSGTFSNNFLYYYYTNWYLYTYTSCFNIRHYKSYSTMKRCQFRI